MNREEKRTVNGKSEIKSFLILKYLKKKNSKLPCCRSQFEAEQASARRFGLRSLRATLDGCRVISNSLQSDHFQGHLFELVRILSRCRKTVGQTSIQEKPNSMGGIEPSLLSYLCQVVRAPYPLQRPGSIHMCSGTVVNVESSGNRKCTIAKRGVRVCDIRCCTTILTEFLYFNKTYNNLRPIVDNFFSRSLRSSYLFELLVRA